MTGKLHLVSHHLCPYVQRAVIVLTEKEIEHERTYIDLSNKPDWFTVLSPTGKVPLLQTETGIVFESQVIAEYLDEITPGSLHPRQSFERARHRSWIEFGSQTLDRIGRFYNAPDAETFETRRRELAEAFCRIDGEIAGPYFSGESFHMIDGVWGTIFRYLDVFDAISDFGLLNDAGAVTEWRGAVGARKTVREAVPEGYHNRLMTFLNARHSYLSSLVGVDMPAGVHAAAAG